MLSLWWQWTLCRGKKTDGSILKTKRVHNIRKYLLSRTDNAPISFVRNNTGSGKLHEKKPPRQRIFRAQASTTTAAAKVYGSSLRSLHAD